MFASKETWSSGQGRLDQNRGQRDYTNKKRKKRKQNFGTNVGLSKRESGHTEESRKRNQKCSKIKL